MARGQIARALEALQDLRTNVSRLSRGVRSFWHMLSDHWTSILRERQRAMSRQSYLEVKPQSEEIIVNDESPLVIYVKNLGPGAAREVEVALMSLDLTITPGILRQRMLVGGDEASFRYQVRPRTGGKRFEARVLVRYLDSDDQARIFVESFLVVAKAQASRGMPRLSPYVWGQPLLAKDSKVFWGREDVFEFLQTRFWGEERNKIIALQGERRMGKTSILYQLGRRNVFRGYSVVMFDFQKRYAHIDTVNEFMYSFAKHLRTEAKLPEELQVNRADFMVGARDYYDAFEQWLDQVDRELERRNTQIVILVDEFERLLSRRFEESVNWNVRLVNELLALLRSMMLTRTRLNWIIAGSWSLVAKQREYFSSVFGMALPYWVSYLKREDAVALIQEPVKEYLTYDQDAIDRILRLTGGHPFYIQIVCDQLFGRAQDLNLRRVRFDDVNAISGDALKQIADTSFHTIWASFSDPMSRKVLSSIAEATPTPGEWVQRPHLLNFMHRKDLRLNEDRFFAVLDLDGGELIRRELVEVHPQDADRLRLHSELLYQWLKKTKPLVSVLREER